MKSEKESEGLSGRVRLLTAFGIMFVLYQLSVAIQTVYAPNHPVGPILMVLTLLAAWPLGQWIGWRGHGAFGLKRDLGSLWLVLMGLCFSGAAVMASRLAGVATGVFNVADTTGSLTLTFLTIALISTFVPSLTEDILTRGFLLKAARKPMTGTSFVIMSAVIYTANHFWSLQAGASEQIRLFSMGLAYGAAAWRYKNLWAAVGLHWGWNLGNALLSQMMPHEVISIEAGRYLSAAANIILFLLVLLVPTPSKYRT